jgi:hypothetical protein
MIVIRPIAITPAVLTASNIAEPDATLSGEWTETVWAAGTYTIGSRRIMTATHKLYEVVAASTTDAPDVGAKANPQTWIEVSATNKYRAFDAVIDTQATDSTSPITYTFEPAGLCNSFAAFNVSGASEVVVTVTDSVEGVVYTNAVDMTDDTLVIDEYTWAFSPVIFRSQVILLDLPAYNNPQIDVSFNGDSNVAVGEIVIGNSLTLGSALYGTAVETVDFSVYETDDFGNRQVVRRRTADLTEFKVGVMKNRINYVRNVLKDLRGVNCVWVGEGVEDDATLVYGFGRGSRIPIETPTMNEMIITVQGLV